MDRDHFWLDEGSQKGGGKPPFSNVVPMAVKAVI
jgi:hypothetical protein